MRSSISRTLLALVMLLSGACALAAESISFEPLNEVKPGISLPTNVTITPFRAYDVEDVGSHPEQGTPTDKMLFKGKVTVPLQVYLAAVVLGEIDIAPKIGTTYYVPGQVTSAQREAFHAQAQAALNCLLYRMAQGTSAVSVSNVAGEVTVTVAGNDPAKNAALGTHSFQSTALPANAAEMKLAFGKKLADLATDGTLAINLEVDTE